MRVAVLVAMIGCHSAAPVSPAPVSSCVAVADHVRALVGDVTDRAHRIGSAFLRRCTDDAWPETTKQCFLGEPDIHAGHHCQHQLATEPRAMLQRDLELARLPPLDATGDPCTHLRALSQRIDTCAALGTETREELRAVSTHILAERDRKPTPGTPIRIRRFDPDAPDAETEECRLGVDAIIKLGAEQCGW